MRLFIEVAKNAGLVHADYSNNFTSRQVTTLQTQGFLRVFGDT
jgi:hypothetical protein